MADPLFKGPSEDEVTQSLIKEKARVSVWKASTIIVVGISNEKNAQGLQPILYSMGVWQRNFTVFPGQAALGRNYSQYMFETWMKRDPEGHIVRDDQGQAARLDPANKEEQEEYARRIREVPSEGFGEEYNPKFTLGVESPFATDEAKAEEEAKAVAKKYSWLRKGKALIYRQQTGKFFNAAEGLDPRVVVAQMTRTIRNILWTIDIAPKEGHAPIQQISGEEIHSAIFERLKTAKQRLQLLKVAKEGADLEANFLVYKVAVISPRGILELFDTVDAALEAAARYYEEELMEEPMSLAAGLSKDEATILLKAAEILDSRAPVIADLIDKTFFVKATISSRDVAASLVRVADRFDADGKNAEAVVADKLLQNMASKPKA